MPDIPRTRSEKCGLERRYNDFKAGRPIVRDGVRDFILDSWLRCLQSFPRREAPVSAYGGASEDTFSRNGFILKTPLPSCRSVFDLLTGPDVGIEAWVLRLHRGQGLRPAEKPEQRLARSRKVSSSTRSSLGRTASTRASSTATSPPCTALSTILGHSPDTWRVPLRSSPRMAPCTGRSASSCTATTTICPSRP